MRAALADDSEGVALLDATITAEQRRAFGMEAGARIGSDMPRPAYAQLALCA